MATTPKAKAKPQSAFVKAASKLQRDHDHAVSELAVTRREVNRMVTSNLALRREIRTLKEKLATARSKKGKP